LPSRVNSAGKNRGGDDFFRGFCYLGFMRRILILAWSLLVFFGFLQAQNSAPVISNLSVNHNPGSQTVSFDFDLADMENDPVEMFLRVSGDSGRTWLVNASVGVTGDVGFPVTAGTGKSISWNYSLSGLSSDGIVGPTDLYFRLIADDRIAIDIQEIVDLVDSSNTVETLQFLEGIRHRTANPTHLNVVRDSIRNLMASSGLQDWHQAWSVGTFPSENFIGRMAGLTGEKRTWYISGHYDTVNNSPGADDNGTATAAVMEAVRLLSAYQFRHSLRFCLFDLEEAGLVGSNYYVSSGIPAWEDVGGLLNMEMIGYFDNAVNTQSLPAGFEILFPSAYNQVEADSFRGNFLTNVANTASDSLRLAFDANAAAYVPGLRVISLAAPGNSQVAPDLRRSDHASFWDAGHPALMLTDAADLRNPYYHSPADTIGTLDLDFFVQNVRAVIATLAQLAVPMHATTASDTFFVDVPVALETQNAAPTLLVYPNPSSADFAIEMHFDHAEKAELTVLTATGQVVRKLASREWASGSHRIIWNGADNTGQGVASGTYYIVLRSESQRLVRKIQRLK
jgi:hypothetical protein